MAAKKPKIKHRGKYQAKPGQIQTRRKEEHLPSVASKARRACFAGIPLAFFFIELFAFFFLCPRGEAFEIARLWPLAFGGLWAVLLSGLIRLLPLKVGRIAFGASYYLAAVYAGFQTGYFVLFSKMMWLSDFRYAAEGADYADVLLSYPLGWWLGIFAMIAIGAALLWKFPLWKKEPAPKAAAAILAAAVVLCAMKLPERVFERDRDIQYASSNYGRSQSAEAAYTNMFDAHRLYQVCGLYQTACKDVYAHSIYPHTPEYVRQQEAATAQIEDYFAGKKLSANEMTGILQGKNVVLVLMEAMDDWMIGVHTPTLVRLMDEGIRFDNFYTPGYGGIRTFNTEFCINTGSFLNSGGGYAFDYVTNEFNQSLASQLTDAGYSAKTFHYNAPTFYSRGEFSPAMGYEEYVCYEDYLSGMTEKEAKNLLYDDALLFDNRGLNDLFFREGRPTLNFVITRSAHLSYKYNEVLSYWALKKYPEYRELTDNEETNCAYVKAKLVDDFFSRLLAELEDKGQLENTVIIGVTDHYTYGYKDMASLYELSGTEEPLLLEKTPWFIWSADLQPMSVDKVLNTADFLPTVLNLLGVESEYSYMGSDAFDESYEGFVPFANGSWITEKGAYDSGTGKHISVGGKEPQFSEEFRAQMDEKVRNFNEINNRILETDYYQ